MIGYTTIGVSDMEAAKTFYTALFTDKGAKIVTDMGRIAFIGTKRGEPMLAICKPYDKNDPTPGNGAMTAFPASDKDEVGVLYEKAIALGATDDGAPGQRIPDRFYGAYVRDPDNNKLCFFVFG
ncbi:VOC family protein [Ascidiaceihabitans sp.]|nr:VOC family protein [Paracoccaceae bacterium]MDB4073423.1 VOC family protein [Ascidiaceihabitans sp.]MDC1303610.1 VOC family protein [Ascidiaceihabitans sp.]HCI08908.1 VOC family protein [Sulfitobacter sp.]